MSQPKAPLPPVVRHMVEQGHNLPPDILEKSAMLYAVHELSRMMSTYFDRVMAEHDLTHAQWWAIMHVMFHEGKSQSDLAHVMQMGRSAAGKILDQIERKGWIERHPDPDDLRVQRVYMRQDNPPDMGAFVLGGEKLFGTFLSGLAHPAISQTFSTLQAIQANGEAELKRLARAEKEATRKRSAREKAISPSQG